MKSVTVKLRGSVNVCELRVKKLAAADIPKIAIENPMGFLNRNWRKADQIIQPYHFGDPESKRTCLWFKNLPLLKHTDVVKPRIYGYFKTGKHKGELINKHDMLSPIRVRPFYFSHQTGRCDNSERARIRSKTFPGIANAMADQWGQCA